MREAIKAKLDGLLKLLEEKGYSEGYITDCKRVIGFLDGYMEESGIDEYSHDIGLQFVEDCRQKKNFSKFSLRFYRLAVRRFDDFVSERGYVRKGERPNRPCPNEYEEVLTAFLKDCADRGNKANTLAYKRCNLVPFFEGLVKNECFSISEITPEFISKALLYTVPAHWATIAMFFRFLAISDILDRDYSLIIPKRPSEFKLPTVYTAEELARVLNVIDRNTNYGKLDYCMLLFAIRLGMRAGDILTLRLSNLHLDEGRVVWTTQKNHEPMDLYISPDMVDAIKDYIEQVRPDSNDDTLFLSLMAPHEPYAKSAVFYRSRKYLLAAGIDITGKRTGPHSFRSSLDSELVNDGESYDTVRKIDGHKDEEAIKYYVKLDIHNLRLCANPVPEATGFFKRFLEGQVKI